MAESKQERELTAWFQQGDVTITPIESIPRDARMTRSRVLAEGEATGHKHQATAENVRLFVKGDILYMRAPTGTSIVHEEHHAVELPPGDYMVGRVREYDHFAEESRPVID